MVVKYGQKMDIIIKYGCLLSTVTKEIYIYSLCTTVPRYLKTVI